LKNNHHVPHVQPFNTLAKVGVEGSNPFARSSFPTEIKDLCRPSGRHFRRHWVTEAQRRANELRCDLETRGVHGDVLAFCRAELVADDYFHAVQEAVKSVAAKMRAKTGLTDDGSTLVDRALGGTPPMIAINPLSSESERGEQRGFANLVRGTFGMFRNPTAHEPRIHWPMSKGDAQDLLTLVSLIHRRLDASHMPARG